ncbi:dna topoisomerase iv subunit b : DNA gyrase subunit B OS=uncultured planctomycete GN=HGMM_F22C11C07 PE=3 SV=1: HATPase_c: DNA_gyraseB: Toprim: DNA_gyraseB_C [Gemmataceae bacterium]|nr:dna topoisomerase iv subunit b : DNA gyrase subunit B OS=uncultured planctomycete GN=HGMM_F22C11C07 PE=3 SV=1: HATPase_c: DNA_gyraseB: Toprim: DNA_gyraseB_C [Gemmataceae bacterium]VTT97852.1 dna topoisomerase iv subunit b : DNA gyrase subunit B OS=uncultured planctomycete GN=HGMM_F22C11C07 PE=3 SV=1: HATPase_c: DNA_gyraseB: Toprim: DNA_gyraseB_C [Gemmataceae bacterium]
MSAAPALKTASTYSTSSIQVLEGLEPVRKRPAMYIGGVDAKGLHHLAWEILDNCVDEYINGHADHIQVVLHKSGTALTITDNGRGIPVDIDPKHKKSGLELVLTVLHAGGKFGEVESGYKTTGGLHGVGASVVNALSKKLVATVKRDGFEYQQAFAKGTPLGKIERVGPARGHGTSIYFEPDETIFKHVKFDPDTLKVRFEDTAFIHSGLHITFKNEVTGETLELANPGGLAAYLTKLVKEADKPGVTEAVFSASRDAGDRIEVALQWTESTEEVYRAYANGIRTPNGGTHENGLKSALRKAINAYIETHDIKVKGLKITADDIREGVVAVLSVFLRDPMFESQTKNRLTNPEMEAAVDNFVRPALEAWLNNNKTAADAIVGRIVLAARAREASRAAVTEVKRKAPGSKRLSLPGKLADCKSTNWEETELFIVEGDSAGGSAKQGRNNVTQAVLPLRGKILNCEDQSTVKALANQEIADLVTAIGTGAGEKFHYDGLRYGKIILLMDADSDGCHISTLLLDFFFRHMAPLVKNGHVYLAQPPLFRLNVGKETLWARDDAHKAEIRAGLKANAKIEETRFKGLGEMDAKDLARTTLDPKFRTLLKVEVDNPMDADQAFQELLGREAESRYNFIMERAEQADAASLDV